VAGAPTICRQLYAIQDDDTSASVRWSYTTGGKIRSSAALAADGTVFVGSFDKSLYALIDGGGSTVTLKWELVTGGEVYSSPAVDGHGNVFVGSLDGKVYGVAGATGAQLWSYATGGGVSGSPAIGGDGSVYIGSADSRLHVVRAGVVSAMFGGDRARSSRSVFPGATGIGPSSEAAFTAGGAVRSTPGM
jgi:outer membrane protein assembly factor BamB